MDGKAYRMTVDRYYIDHAIDRYKVFAGEKEIQLQSNIPELQRTKGKTRAAWKIVSSNFNIGTSNDTALAIQRLFREIEEEVLHSKSTYIEDKSK